MSTVCRCCLIEGRSMKNLFLVQFEHSNDDEAKDLTLADAYVLCTNLQLRPDTRQSSEICFNCEEKLLASYKFIIECRKASSKLILGNNGLKVDEDFWNAEFLYNVPSLSKGNFFGEDQNALELLKRSISESSDDNSTEFDFSLEGFDDEPEIIGKEISKEKITDHKFKLKCTECKRKFFRHNTYRMHFEKVHNSDWECEYCEERFTSHSIQTYLEHRQIHTSDPVFNCKVCNFIFRRKKCLYSHRCSEIRSEEPKTVKSDETPSEETPSKFTCKVCNASFTSNEKYNTHKKNHDSKGAFIRPVTTVQSLLCTICGHKATRPASLIQHQRTHTGEKPFGCEICGKRFSQRSTLSYHKQLHTGMKAKCELCPKGFPSNSLLKRHMRFHNNEKLYKCEPCEKTYLCAQSLQEHIKTHHKLIRYKCSHCEQEFTDRSHRKIHETIHTGKPWWCPKCNYKSTRKSTLKLHISNVHKLNIDDLNVKNMEPATTDSNDGEGFSGEQEFTDTSHGKTHKTIHKPWWCPKCNFKSARKHGLKSHLSNIHKMDIDDLNVKKMEPPGTTDSNDGEVFGGGININEMLA